MHVFLVAKWPNLCLRLVHAFLSSDAFLVVARKIASGTMVKATVVQVAKDRREIVETNVNKYIKHAPVPANLAESRPHGHCSQQIRNRIYQTHHHLCFERANLQNLFVRHGLCNRKLDFLSSELHRREQMSESACHDRNTSAHLRSDFILYAPIAVGNNNKVRHQT